MSLTAARRRGLAVIVRHPNTVRRSNQTHEGRAAPAVYWQTADWLEANGYATVAYSDNERITMSPEGWELARREGLL